MSDYDITPAEATQIDSKNAIRLVRVKLADLRHYLDNIIIDEYNKGILPAGLLQILEDLDTIVNTLKDGV